ncbi:hypothetical protein JCM8547_009048 [Rhodosporidiobolus lusitaniae]
MLALDGQEQQRWTSQDIRCDLPLVPPVRVLTPSRSPPSSVSSPQPELGQDYLSKLPVELLTEIFRLAYADGCRPTGPVCRVLLPFDCSSRFHQIEVKSVEQFRKLAKLLEASQFSHWTEHLKFEHVDEEEVALKDRQLKAFFASFPKLAHLELAERSSSLLSAVLSNSLTRASMRSVVKLSTMSPEGKNPFEPAPFRLLTAYPSLNSLAITSKQDIYDLSRVKASKEKVPTLPHITSLTVNSEGADLPLVTRLIDACPNLKNLVLSCTSQHPNFPRLLPLVPAHLESFELKTLAFYDEFKPAESSPSFVRLLTLTTLGFGKGAIVDVKHLVELVDGPSRLPHLKHLIFDIMEGKIGYEMEKNGHRLHPSHKPPLHIGPDWIVPRFTIDEKAPGSIRQAAEKNGI